MDLMMLVPRSDDRLNSEGAPCITHSCKIPPKWDELNNVIKGDGQCAKVRRWFRRNCLVSLKHPNTRFYLRSKAATSYEYVRHATSYVYMIHPFSQFRIYWESMMIVASIFALLVVPFRITFLFELPHGEWFLIILVLNSILLSDVILWFFTGHYDRRTNIIVLEPRLVARKYATGWFLADLLSSLPMEVFTAFADSTSDTIQLYSYFQILKIIRLRLIFIYGNRLKRVYNMTFQVHKVLELVITMTIVLHWAACAEYYVSSTVRRMVLQSGKAHDNWTNLPRIKNQTLPFKYTTSLYRAVTAMVSSSKYEPAESTEDVILDIILTIFGPIANIYVIAQWFQLLNTARGPNNSHMRLLPQLQEYMRHKELPIEIQKRLVTYYSYCSQRSLDLERKIISQLSMQLKEDLMTHRTRKLLKRVSFYKYLPEPVVSRITMSLRTEVFLTNDAIMKAGTPGDSMYFIVSGTVAIYTSMGKEVCHLEDGAHFGEISLIVDNEPHVASVVAVEICELYVLDKEDFQQAIEPYPKLMTFLQKMVLERLQTSLFLGEIYRLEGNIPEVNNDRRSTSNNIKSKNKQWDNL